MEDSFNRWKLQLFSGFRLREPLGSEVTTRSRRLIDLMIILALQKDFSYSRHALAKQIFWDTDEGPEERLTVLLSRASTKLNSYGKSFLGITGDTVWLEPSLIEVDLAASIALIEKIADEAAAGRPVKRLFESLGALISPLELSPGNIFVDEALSTQKQRLRHLIQSRLVPATGSRYADSIGSLIDVLGLEDASSATSCSQLMLTFAGLGDIGAIHRVFARHEDAMDEEFGSVVSHTTHEVYALALATSPHESKEHRYDSIPDTPRKSFGLDHLLQKLENLTRTARKGDLIEIIGPPGSGKTHILSQLYSLLSGNDNVRYYDFNQIDHDIDLEESTQAYANVILLDNFTSRNQSALVSLFSSTSATIAIVASEKSNNFSGCTGIAIPPLEAGTSIEFGPAIQLLVSALEPEHFQRVAEDRAAQFRQCNELVTLTGGNPGTLMKSLDIVRALGFKAGIEFIRTELLSFGTLTMAQSDHSFRKEILKRLDSIGEEHLRCCKILARLKEPISTQALIQAGSFSPSIFRDINSMGIAKLSENHTILLNEPVQVVLNSSDFGRLSPEEWSIFCDTLLLWLMQKAEEISDSLELALSVSSFEVVCTSLLDRQNSADGLHFYEALSKWFASNPCSLETTLRAEAALVVNDELPASDWVKIVAAVGKGLFYRGQYEKLLSIVQWANSSSKFELLNQVGKYRLVNFLGLAYRCLENLEAAEQCYLDALKIAPTPEAKVTLNYNLGCLAERKQNKLRALQLYEQAALEFTSSTDRRLMSQNTIDIMRLRAELFPKESNFENGLNALFKESALANDRRAQNIILTDIGESKYRDGQLGSSAHYMIIGVYLCFQMGFSKNTIQICRTTINLLVTCLSELGLTEVSAQLEIVALTFGGEEPEWRVLLEHKMVPLVLSDILMRGLHELCQMGVRVPVELNSFFKECDEIHANTVKNVPTVSTLESLSLQLQRSRTLEHDESQSSPNGKIY